MRNFILGLTALICIISTNAQCIKEISTNPVKSFNTEFNSIQPTLINPFKNSFNWGSYTNQTFNSIYLNPNAGWSILGNPGYMHSPFSTNMPSDYAYLNNNGALPQKCDWHWEDGWELLWMNTGYYPNGERIDEVNNNRLISNSTGLANPNTPYFFLYNRYTGKIRGFANLFTSINGNSINSIIAKIGHTNYTTSGTFRHLSNYDRPLDMNTTIPEITTYNSNPNNNNAWFSSDFQMGFDPCVCDYPSQWKFDFQAITTFDVNLYSRTLSNSLPLGGANTPDYNTFLTNNDLWNKQSGGSSLMFKSLDGMFTEYKADLDRYNSNLLDYNSIENKIKRELAGMGKSAIVDGVTSLIPGSEILSLTTKIIGKMRNAQTPVNKPSDKAIGNKVIDQVTKGTKALLGKGTDFLSISLIGEQNKPVAPNMPTANFAESRIVGNIGHSSGISITNFYVPGSFNPNINQLTAFNYPAYNKPLGLFALLRTPKIDLYKNTNYSMNPDVKKTIYNTSEIISQPTTQNPLAPWVSLKKSKYDYGREISYKSELYFKLNEALLYRYNHNVDFNFDLTNCYVAFEVEYVNDMKKKEYYLEDGITETEYTEQNLYVDHNLPASDNSGQARIFTSSWANVAEAKELLFGLTFTDKEFIYLGTETHSEKYHHRTGISTDVQQDITGPVLNQEQFDDLVVRYKPKIKSIKMKLMPDMYFKQIGSNGGNINTVQSFTYLLFDDEKNIDLIALKGNYVTQSNIGQLRKYHAGTLELGNEEISPSKPYVIKQVGNTLFVDAEQIKITGNLTVTSGYNAELRSYEEIEINPTISIEPNISLEIKRDFYGLGSNLEADDAQVSDFCKGNNKEYKANELSASAKMILEKDSIENAKANTKTATEHFQFKLYPNPANSTISVDYNANASGDYVCEITDVVGKKVFVTTKSFQLGQNLINYDVTNLTQGVYFFTIINKATGIQSTKQFIKSIN